MYQPHFLSEEGIDFAEKLAISRAGSWEKLTRKGRAGYLRNRLLNQELHRLRQTGGRVKVITMVRDPLATNLSGLFHNYPLVAGGVEAGSEDPPTPNAWPPWSLFPRSVYP